jgi:hypothetical protein
MLYSEIIAVCSDIHTKHINTLCGQKVELLSVKHGGTYSNHWALKCYTFHVDPNIWGLWARELVDNISAKGGVCITDCLTRRMIFKSKYLSYIPQDGRGNVTVGQLSVFNMAAVSH